MNFNFQHNFFSRTKPVGNSFIYLLDLHPGAAKAHSNFLLSSTYSGDCKLVRRTADNVLQAVGFTSNFLDVSSLLAFAQGGDVAVVTEYDQSGNGFDYTQANAAEQALIVKSGVLVTENSLAVMEFDGIDDRYTGTSGVYTPQYSEFVVAKNTSSSVFSALIAHGTGSIQGYLGTRGNGVRWGTFEGGDRTFGSTNGQLQQISRTKELGTDIISNYVNGVAGDVYTSSQPVQFAGLGCLVPGSGHFKGLYAEAVLYPSDMSADREAIEAIQRNNWGI